MFKWNYLGWQGSKLAPFLREPIKVSSITIGSKDYDQQAMERTFLSRFKDDKSKEFDKDSIELIQDKNVDFVFQRRDNLVPSPCTLIYSKYEAKIEIAVNGRKEGIVKKHFGTDKARLKICKRKLSEKLNGIIKHPGSVWSFELVPRKKK